MLINFWPQVFFSFNSLLLPHGLLFTTALSPILLWLQSRRVFFIGTFYVTLVLLPYLTVHLIFLEINYFEYFKSIILFIINYYAVLAMAVYCSRISHWNKLFVSLLKVSFCIYIVGVVFLFTPLNVFFWRVNETISAGVVGLTRYKALVYEPSYFSTLIAPLVAYFIFKYIEERKVEDFFWCLLGVILLVSSFSLGVIACMVFSFLVVFLIRVLYLLNFGFVWAGLACICVILVVAFTTDNPLSNRAVNVLNGSDNSGNARTSSSLIITEKILDDTNYVFGAGFGQVKLFMKDRLHSLWYQLTGSVNDFVLPSAWPDLIAHLGILGGLIKLFIEVFILFRFKVYKRIYGLFLWVFVFIYQFTGSFMTNQAEYIIWIMACISSIQFEKLGDDSRFNTSC